MSLGLRCPHYGSRLTRDGNGKACVLDPQENPISAHHSPDNQQQAKIYSRYRAQLPTRLGPKDYCNTSSYEVTGPVTCSRDIVAIIYCLYSIQGSWTGLQWRYCSYDNVGIELWSNSSHRFNISMMSVFIILALTHRSCTTTAVCVPPHRCRATRSLRGLLLCI